MSVKFFNFKIPHGMALQPFADGSYNLLYDDKNTVLLRDFFAGLTNTLTDTAVKHLEEQKNADRIAQEKRTERARATAFPVSKAAGLEKEKQRISTYVEMMGSDDVPGGTIHDRSPSVPPPKKELLPPKSNRVVNTTQGPLEVAPDVSNDDVRALGYLLVGDKDQPVIGQSANGQDTTSATDVEHSDPPEEASP